MYRHFCKHWHGPFETNVMAVGGWPPGACAAPTAASVTYSHGMRGASVWGLVADVHGNLAALDTALSALRDAGATRLAFLGDYLGRGASDACVARIQAVGGPAVVGNRDLDWQDRVAAETKAWVLSLPLTIADGPLLLAHGDARLTPGTSTAEIGRGFVKAWAQLTAAGAVVLAFGHSHQARTWRKVAAEAPAEMLPASTTMGPGYRYFVNVGSTGLPFPGKGGPSVALVDFAAGRIAHLPLAGPERR